MAMPMILVDGFSMSQFYKTGNCKSLVKLSPAFAELCDLGFIVGADAGYPVRIIIAAGAPKELTEKCEHELGVACEIEVEK